MDCLSIFAEAVDLGGPRREFFACFLRLARKKIVRDDQLIDEADVVEMYSEMKLYFVFGLITGISNG